LDGKWSAVGASIFLSGHHMAYIIVRGNAAVCNSVPSVAVCDSASGSMLQSTHRQYR
jgi:hypothetical protein